MQETTHYDDFQDTLVVSRDNDGAVTVYASEGETEVQLCFTPEVAQEIASSLVGDGTPANPSDLSDPRRAWNEHVFGLAAQFGRVAIFDYQKEHSTSIEKRRLRPESVEDGIVRGQDLARSDIRAFRLDRVQGWAKVG